MIHEGAKVGQDLLQYVHLGWPGGVERPNAVDWSKIIGLKKALVVLACDNDQEGIDVATTISQILMRQLSVILFDVRFPPTFDLADDWPEGKDFWEGEKYVGPSFNDCLFPATWATKIGKAEGKGRPPAVMRNEFAKEWFWVIDPAVFAHERHSDRILDEQAFNRSVRPFSHVANTAALLINHFPSRCDTVTYDPGRKPGLVNIGELRLLNTFRPSTIMATTGDPTPFHDYMTYLIPDDGDRKEVLRWCATLIAKPEIKMSYGVLLISETQGIGKGTLGEAILTPLLGEANVSSPDEQEITESNFNGWIPHKRLAVGP